MRQSDTSWHTSVVLTPRPENSLCVKKCQDNLTEQVAGGPGKDPNALWYHKVSPRGHVHPCPNRDTDRLALVANRRRASAQACPEGVPACRSVGLGLSPKHTADGEHRAAGPATEARP